MNLRADKLDISTATLVSQIWANSASVHGNETQPWCVHAMFSQISAITTSQYASYLPLRSCDLAVSVESFDNKSTAHMASEQGVLTAPERPPSFAHSSRLDTRGMSFSLSRVLELRAKPHNQTHNTDPTRELNVFQSRHA